MCWHVLEPGLLPHPGGMERTRDRATISWTTAWGGGCFLGRAAPGAHVLSVSVMTLSEVCSGMHVVHWACPGSLVEKWSCVRPSDVALVSGDNKVISFMHTWGFPDGQRVKNSTLQETQET
ncbi:unnamed protein product [Rangifer tarandus platyrhynchus]|uniref:Uncharacterized protein n=1 Tax=Rangifer tarandus platyrhynchus TaxID=3082113 RepID=A0AC59ZXP3_RANTA